ncbi:TORC2 complex subunit TSC11 [Sporobolomyces koalae]|uniref:TORC2 complex subunit TSC11 n=1 Tax=Sporobolomyces koalae TaxID=500713 RepID=UPI0031743CEA
MSSPSGSSTPLTLSNSTELPALSPQVRLENLKEQLSVQQAIADGASNFLSVVATAGPAADQDDLRSEVLQELQSAQGLIEQLEQDIETLEQSLARDSAPQSGSANGIDFNRHSQDNVLDHETESYDSDSLYPALEKLQDALAKLQEFEDQIGERIKVMDEIVDSLAAESRLAAKVPLDRHLPSVMCCLAESAGKDVRAGGRLPSTRHSILPLTYPPGRSLARDAKHDLEKEQALRLTRRIIELSPIVSDHPQDRARLVAILRGIVALAEQSEEKLKMAALETLGELVIRDISLLVACEGLRVVLQAISDGGSGAGPHDLSPILAMSFLGIVDHPDLRRWLRPGVDLEIVLSGFTEVQGKGAGIEDRIKASAQIVETLLKSWSGLLYLNVNGRQAVTSLVDSLTNPSRIVRDTLLDMLSNIFSVRRIAKTATSDSIKQPRRSNADQRKTNLIDQYTALLLLIFIDAGLIEGLAELAATPQDSSTSSRTSALIGEVLELSNRVLPPRLAAHLQSLPRLFALSISFETSDQRLNAGDTLSAIAELNREKRIAGIQRSVDAEISPTPLEDSSQRSLQQRQLVESDKLRVAISMDDITFRNLLLESGVLSSKDDSKWSFDLLIELMEGPLRNPKRLDEAMNASKFMRRVLAFFQPASFRYSDVRLDDVNASKYTRLGRAMVNTLLSDPAGVQHLAEDKLLLQIADCLLQLEPVGAAGSGVDVLFSKERSEKTLVSGYFELLGEMTKSTAGLALLDQYKIFTCFYRISELRSRDDLVKLIIEKMDYTRDGHPRVFLHKSLTSSYQHVRLFATNFLASLIRQSSASHSTRCAEWQIDLLVPQLYDPAPEVTKLAISVLTLACTHQETLEMVVRKRPEVEHLAGDAVELLTQFLGTAVGVNYLHEIDFIENELDDWYEERNYQYMVNLELSMAAAMQPDHMVLAPTLFDGTPPSHFYGELVKTAEGCDILEDSGHFLRFCDVIRQHAEHDLDPDYIAQLKSVLWAVGHIGSVENGLMFLEDELILADIVEIACTSPVYSLRGTAAFALALISSTEEGVEMLEELGWESIVKPLTGPTGLCVPMDLDDLLYTPVWPSPQLPLPESLLLAAPTSHVDRDALVCLANLSNHILATKASKQLAKLKSRHRSHFASPALYYRALDMLASHHYRQPVRTFIVDLFDYDFDAESATRLVLAGDDLVKRKLEQGQNGNLSMIPSQSNGVGSASWAQSGVSAAAMMDGGFGIEGDVTEDEDQSSIGDDAQTTKIPLKTLTPLLTVRGFLLS